MIEDFLQKKIAALLQQFIEFQKFKFGNKQGMSIKNTTIKPKLVEELSQILSMPLQHVAGSVSSLSLNLPWQRLFMLKESEIQLSMEGVKLRSKLRNCISQPYILKKREREVESLTQKLFNPLDSSNKNSSFINKKLQEYFLSTIVLQIKNLCLQIEIDLKHKVQLILRVQSCVFRKQNRRSNQKNKINLKLEGVGLYYRNGGNKEVQLISPANFCFQRVKTEGGQLNKRVSIYNINIDRILVHMNNYNYGDIARVLLLIQWHNSFMNVPYEIWKVKPFVLSECKPSAKFIYCAHLIKQSIVDNNFRKQLLIRRRYVTLYTKFLTNTLLFSEVDKLDLNEMQKNMPLWKIAAFRSFSINSTKRKIENLKVKKAQELATLEKGGLNSQQKDSFYSMANMVNGLWFRRWFDSEQDSNQLQKQFLSKIASIESAPSEVESMLNVKVQTIAIKIQIITAFGVEPFISLIGYHCQFTKQALLIEKTWQKTIQFRKCKIQFEKYLGHHDRYKNMLCQSKDHFCQSQLSQRQEEQQDEFEDINYFLQMNYKNDSKVIQINLLPFDLYINHQIIEKLNVLLNLETLAKISKVQKIEEAYLLQYDPWLIVQHQREKVIQLKKSLQISVENFPSPLKRQIEEESTKFSDRVAEDIEQQKQICLKSAANIIVMADLRVYPSTELVLQLGSFEVKIRPNGKEITLKKISLIGKFLPKAQEQQEEQPIYLSLIEPQISIFRIIPPFNVRIQLKSHVFFDEAFFYITPLQLQLPPLDHALNIIQLIFLHIPKQKENRLKQYYRRKQSIGQEFMDACQNLNEHINKSMVMSSEKMTVRTVIKQKRTKISNLNIESIDLSAEFIELGVKDIQLSVKQVGYDKKFVESYNKKDIRVVVNNIKQTLKSMKIIQNQLKKESNKKGWGQKIEQKGERKFSNIQIAHINLQIVLILRSKKGDPLNLHLQATNIKYEQNQEVNSKRIEANFKMSYDEEVQNSERKLVKIPLIEECSIQHEETIKFNFHQSDVRINSLAINIKPSLFRFMALLVREYHIDDKTKFTLTNGVANVIQIKVPPRNFYIDQRHNHKSIFVTPCCEMALFNKKFSLQFNQHQHQDIPKPKIQCIELSQNNFLMNRETSPNEYLLQSNVRIVNHQDRTIWIKLGENQTQSTPEQIQNRSKFSMLTFQHRPYSIDLEQQISLKERDWDGFSPSRNRFERKEKSGRSMSLPLKQKQMLHLLIDSQQHRFIQIVDQGNRYTQLLINQLFEATEIVVSNEDSDESEYLVIRSEITQVQGIQGSIYTFHIYSPVYIVNKTPWILEYRLSEDQGISSIIDNEQKKPLRRRSFQLIPMKKISSLYSEKIRSLHYSEIQSMKLSLKKYERDFPSLSNLVQKIKQVSEKEKGGFIKDSELITLQNGRSEIQVILCLEFSDNIMKIKLHPQFVFVNLSSIPLQFRVKEEEVTYHQIKLRSLRVGEKDKKVKESSNNPNAYLNQLANLSQDKLKTREVLKQLFQTYDGDLETFTGNLKKQISKKIVYYSGKEILKRQLTFLQSSTGYLSQYVGSDAQFLQQKTLKTQSYIMAQQPIKYGPDEHMIFKRAINIQKYFNLVIFLPTVHIINKSQATFYAKSQSELLVKIAKESHNYIVTNHNTVDLQACLEDQDISLSQWTRVDLQELRTIYYSKDMIQHHGSGYQSKEYTFRKKRMKKVPKIFYKVIICRYQWGQKVLIQESQYPPISFINNTSHRIKIQEASERFNEELINRGDMGEYAPKDPYHTPFFRLSVAQHYQYRPLKEFGVAERQIFTLDYGILLSIEQYKDKVIINIKEPIDAKLTVSTIQKNLLKQFQQKGDLLLQQVKKQTIQIKEVTVAILNNWNRELNATLIEEFILSHENKNHKDYYQLKISRIEGYDYMGIQPEYIFHQKKREKPRFVQIQDQKPTFIDVTVVVNYHKNALILEQCEGKITDSVFYISADLMLAYVKNYYDPVSTLKEVIRYYSADGKGSQMAKKRFIVQSLKLHQTSLTIKARNLSIMQTFLNKNYEKFIIKFLNWIGDIKPFIFDQFTLNHEQITLKRLITQVNFRKKTQMFGTLLMDYPLSELKQIVMLLFGDDDKPILQKLRTLYKIVKSLEYILSWALSHNQNMRQSLQSYNQKFIQQNKSNLNILDKIKRYQYCQWKYSLSFPQNKLKGKYRRLERYNTRNKILKYEDEKSHIKMAMDSYLQNKIERRVGRIYRINQENFTAIMAEGVVVYFGNKNQWIVVKPELMLHCGINKNQLVFSFWESDNEMGEDSNGNPAGRVKELKFSRLDEGDFDVKTLEEFNSEIRENILVSYY